MYVAEFMKDYNHNTGKNEWKVKAVFDMNLSDIFVKNHSITKQGINYVREINPNRYAYKLINEEDVTISGNCMDCTVANSKFETYKDF